MWLLQINEALPESTDIKLPEWLGGINLPLRYALLVGFFRYHPRVLNAWVAKYIASARKVFSEKGTVEAREVYVPLPATLNKKSSPTSRQVNCSQPSLKSFPICLTARDRYSRISPLYVEVSVAALLGKAAARATITSGLYLTALQLLVLDNGPAHIAEAVVTPRQSALGADAALHAGSQARSNASGKIWTPRSQVPRPLRSTLCLISCLPSCRLIPQHNGLL